MGVLVIRALLLFGVIFGPLIVENSHVDMDPPDSALLGQASNMAGWSHGC